MLLCSETVVVVAIAAVVRVVVVVVVVIFITLPVVVVAVVVFAAAASGVVVANLVGVATAARVFAVFVVTDAVVASSFFNLSCPCALCCRDCRSWCWCFCFFLLSGSDMYADVKHTYSYDAVLA